MPHPLGLSPSKIIAVHLNYRSRAQERGRTPREPSYFLKPPSSLAADGQQAVRPRGAEALGVEGEIAVIIGKRARNVPVESAAEHIGGIAAANDIGCYDLRYADRGSNVRSKGTDGYTPVGPAVLDPSEVDLKDLRIRLWVNGELVQDDNSGNLLFDFEHLIADLSRSLTLEPGDIILTGTPAAPPIVQPGDVVEVEVGESGRLRTTIAEAEEPMSGPGALPALSEKDREDAFGKPSGLGLLEETERNLRSAATATLSAQLRKRGIHHAFIESVRPAKPGSRLLGRAHTLRYLPLREDVFAKRGGGYNAQKSTIDSIRPGEVLVIDARGDAHAGTIGDILALRVQRAGGTGIVTDGGVRDSGSFADLDIPTYAATQHAAVLGNRHVPWEDNVAVACGGALVEPGDVLVGDDDGVVVIPPGLADEVAADAVEQERQERFIYQQVDAGHRVEGLYPLSGEWKQRYEQWRGGEE
ncbi:2-keto-4-pentenoate hydratase/2-oxohepta-3-ene-1,7-dioic acid hydratase (catechol pathway) [Saccharopolyspora antimicrobica]|uniref:2-keto-4-pentenoate hydratase/2-oxohepta-3-ene-1,7-dioic acid hydratase (Catechol pathway) n=1 Tax=Saccharopolyspora antimicrobica TaxID=455193 RepID=A0A1I5H1J6_9PSEU|nr:fumarylacetoacetate hydrolase family protein [Saccharopolyspora antimicrobica]RKT90079.1 2-keto-4-pentenoate hydratase/2-oxohepta-3-ene-1,7-dioic acid hydratase in catechol pathway [Saccharopolyspora antimicrobica]SFO42144.1 2-keto-4-pentenoate hydratase/2-oxohepta-3-ene-1,7-dioic acid hydratase (catechol pathway) [Saccharopolyspora antimicrobica]